MIKFKACNVRPLTDILSPRHWHFPVLRNSRAIAKFHNTEIGHFGHNPIHPELIRGSLSDIFRYVLVNIVPDPGAFFE